MSYYKMKARSAFITVVSVSAITLSLSAAAELEQIAHLSVETASFIPQGTESTGVRCSLLFKVLGLRDDILPRSIEVRNQEGRDLRVGLMEVFKSKNQDHRLSFELPNASKHVATLETVCRVEFLRRKETRQILESTDVVGWDTEVPVRVQLRGRNGKSIAAHVFGQIGSARGLAKAYITCESPANDVILPVEAKSMGRSYKMTQVFPFNGYQFVTPEIPIGVPVRFRIARAVLHSTCHVPVTFVKELSGRD